VDWYKLQFYDNLVCAVLGPCMHVQGREGRSEFQATGDVTREKRMQVVALMLQPCLLSRTQRM